MAKPRAVASLMIQGTGSDVGKSLLVAGLGRAFSLRGLRVKPFKPQNMSNNAAVARLDDGSSGYGEIGRAQALQALACHCPPTVHMNPILLKPQAEGRSQVIIHGKRSQIVPNAVSGREYQSLKPRLLPMVMQSWQRLHEDCDLLLVEGAGSAAEINLRLGDIANMGFAEAADIAVVLVGDIDRGGVIAALVGTHCLLPQCERDRIKGFIINRFRGDESLFDSAIARITAETGWRSLGIVPWFDAAAALPAEDSLALSHYPTHIQTGENQNGKKQYSIRQNLTDKKLVIAVPILPHIANFDDLDPLRLESRVELVLVRSGQRLPRDTGLVILLGSKATLADLAELRLQGWDNEIAALVSQGCAVLGLCGGLQILGQTISDPLGIEGSATSGVTGLELLPIDTVLSDDKRVTPISGVAGGTFGNCAISGYEIHLGKTSLTNQNHRQAVTEFLPGLEGAATGFISANRQIMGTYLHGIFNGNEFRRAFLAQIDTNSSHASHANNSQENYAATIEQTLDQLAELLESRLNLDQLLAIARG